MDSVPTPTVTELIAEGLSDGGFRSEHALAMAMADASPEMVIVLREARSILGLIAASPDITKVISRIDSVLAKATIPAVTQAS